MCLYSLYAGQHPIRVHRGAWRKRSPACWPWRLCERGYRHANASCFLRRTDELLVTGMGSWTERGGMATDTPRCDPHGADAVARRALLMERGSLWRTALPRYTQKGFSDSQQCHRTAGQVQRIPMERRLPWRSIPQVRSCACGDAPARRKAPALFV